MLAHDGVVDGLQERALHGRGEQRVEQLLGGRAELVFHGVPALYRGLRALDLRGLEREELDHRRLLAAGGEELHVHDVNGGDLAAREAVDEGLRDAFDVAVLGLVAECVGLGGHAVELEERCALASGDLDLAVLAAGGGPQVGHGGAKRGAVVRAAEAAVGGDDERQRPGPGLEAFGRAVDERMRSTPAVGEIGRDLADELEDALGVRPSGHGLLLGAGELAGSNHLHRLGDAPDVADGLDALLDFAGLAHRGGRVGAGGAGAKLGRGDGGRGINTEGHRVSQRGTGRGTRRLFGGSPPCALPLPNPLPNLLRAGETEDVLELDLEWDLDLEEEEDSDSDRKRKQPEHFARAGLVLNPNSFPSSPCPPL